MRVMIADDEAVSRMMLANVFENLGFEVFLAEDGNQAWEILDWQGAMEVAVIDWYMPNMDGITLVQRIRKHPRFNTMKLLMISVQSELDNLTQALEAGADEYAIKPVNQDIVQKKLELLGLSLQSGDLRE